MADNEEPIKKKRKYTRKVTTTGKKEPEKEAFSDLKNLPSIVLDTSRAVSDEVAKDAGDKRGKTVTYSEELITTVSDLFTSAVSEAWATDLSLFAKQRHAKRSVINPDDVALLFRRNRGLLEYISSTSDKRACARPAAEGNMPDGSISSPRYSSNTPSSSRHTSPEVVVLEEATVPPLGNTSEATPLQESVQSISTVENTLGQVAPQHDTESSNAKTEESVQLTKVCKITSPEANPTNVGAPDGCESDDSFYNDDDTWLVS
uniref:Centromere protein S n=1 Tax=Steinernema glaseri TaxID=37863 RepID=A0A1I8AEZ3_9BILA